MKYQSSQYLIQPLHPYPYPSYNYHYQKSNQIRYHNQPIINNKYKMCRSLAIFLEGIHLTSLVSKMYLKIKLLKILKEAQIIQIILIMHNKRNKQQLALDKVLEETQGIFHIMEIKDLTTAKQLSTREVRSINRLHLIINQKLK